MSQHENGPEGSEATGAQVDEAVGDDPHGPTADELRADPELPADPAEPADFDDTADIDDADDDSEFDEYGDEGLYGVASVNRFGSSNSRSPYTSSVEMW